MKTVDYYLLAVCLVLFITSVICAMAEIAFIRVNRIHVMSMVDQGKKNALKLQQMVDKPEATLNVLLLILLIAQLGTASIISVIVEGIGGLVAVVVSIVVEISLFFVLGEVAPKTYAVQNTEKIALKLTPFLWFLTKFPLFRWISSALIGFANIILPGKGLKKGPFVTELDLRSMADVAAEESVIEHTEREMIHSIFEFTDTVAREAMQPRTDMVTVSYDAKISDALNISIEAGYSRIPIFKETRDQIVGLVYQRDMFEAERAGNGQESVQSIKRTAVYIPEQKRTAELLRDMQSSQFHMAIVVDEYGGTAGLITLEDLVEELVGDISDEYDSMEETIETISENVWRVPGRTTIDDLEELLDLEIPDTEWYTVSGLVFNICQHVPYEGEKINYENLDFYVERVVGQRIISVTVTKNDVSEIEDSTLDQSDIENSKGIETKDDDASPDYVSGKDK